MQHFQPKDHFCTNNGNRPCLINIEVPKETQSSKFSFHFEPNNFELGKKKTTKVLVLLKTTKNTEELTTVFTVEATSSKEADDLQNLLQINKESIVNYVYCQTILPSIKKNTDNVYNTFKRMTTRNFNQLGINFLKTLGSYVPTMILKQVVQRTSPLLEPEHSTFNASILFI